MTDISPPATASHPLSDGSHRAPGAARVVRALEQLSPALATRVAEALFVKTRRPPPRPDEAAWLSVATTEQLRVLGRRIAVHHWGPSDGSRVVLTHGWWSHAGRFVAMGAELVSRGHHVIAFDAPGHGRSSGWRASMPEFARTLRAVVESVDGVHGAVGHSLGGAATLFAQARGLGASRIAVIAAPADIVIWVDRFAAALDLSPRLDRRLRDRLRSKLGVEWHEVDMAAVASGLRVPGLVVHDTDDGDVPVREGEALAAHWPGAALHVTSGLGHRKLLRDPAIIARVAAHLTPDPR